MNLLEEIAGEVCKILLPIEERVYRGNAESDIAICTLSSMRLLEDLGQSPLMSKVRVAGRLLSENKGIATLVRTVLSDGKIRVILLCGREVQGHRAGHSLFCLCKNGIDSKGRILGSESPDPVVDLTEAEVSRFQGSVEIVDMIGKTDLPSIESGIREL